MHLTIKQKKIRNWIYRFFKLLIFFSASLMSQVEFPQQNRNALTGFVRDSETKQPLPGASIRLLGSSQGTTTNLEGAYKIMLAPGNHRISFRYVGFHSDTLKVQFDSIAVQCDIFLQSTTVAMSEVVVFGNQPDPAEEIILRAITHKHKILAQLNSYKFNAYTKTTLRLKDREKETKDTSIIALCETQTSCSWKAPDQYKEVINARRQSANLTPDQNIFTVGRIPNFNEDNIVFEPYTIVSPIADHALDYYQFAMIDTLAMDDFHVFRIRMKPKSTLRPLFDGIISIADKSYLVMHVDVRCNEVVDLAPLKDLRVRQQFALFENKFWLPTESITTLQVELSFLPPIFVEQYSLMYDYTINKDIDNKFFDNIILSALPTADQMDASYWHSVNMLPLTKEETKAYKRMDSITTNAGFFAHTLTTLSNLSLSSRDPQLTKFSDFFHFNRVEGAYIGFGIKFDKLLPQTFFTIKTGYEFADKRLDYTFNLERFLFSRNTISLGAQIHSIKSFREGEELISRGDISILALLDKNDPVDYFEATGWSLFARVKPMVNTSMEIKYLHEQNTSVKKNTNFSILSWSEEYRPNPPILEGNLRSGIFTVTYDMRKYSDVGSTKNFDGSQNSFWATYSMERSDKRLFHSDFQFTRYAGTLNFHILTFSSGALDGFLRCGYSSDRLPPQRIFDLFGSTADLSSPGSLRTIRFKEFAGDRFVSLQFEHNFGSLPFRALGISFMKNKDFILFTGSAWSDLSAESRVIQPVPLQTCRSVLNEIGFGFGRLFTFFRTDFAWRLTGNAKNDFTVTLGSPLW